MAGHGRAGPEWQSRARLSTAGQNRAGKSGTAMDSAGHGRVGQNKRQDKSMQNGAKRRAGRAEQSRAE